MYKVIIVEDEKYIREGIKVSADWNQLGFEISGEAGDGDDGLQLALNIKPDVVLADVRMPGMNGLEMAKQILKNFPDTKIIIISGYSDYVYLRESIILQLFDYIIKPIHENELLNVLLKITEKLKEIEFRKKHDFENRNLIFQNKNLKQREVLNRLITGSIKNTSFENLGEAGEFLSGFQNFMTGIIRVVNLAAFRKGSCCYDQNSLEAEIENYIDKGNNSVTFKLFVKTDREREIVLLSGIRENSLDMINIQTLCDNIVQGIKDNGGTKINIGIGLMHPLDGIEKSYIEAKIALDSLDFKDCFLVRTFSENLLKTQQDLSKEFEDIFRKAFKDSNKIKVLNLLDALLSKIRAQKSISRKEITTGFIRIIEITRDEIFQKNSDLQYLMKDDYIALFDNIDSFDELWHSFVQIVSELMNQLDLSAQNLNEVVAHIKKFIDKNYYSNQISLDYLSSHFFIDPFSLSKIFKRLYDQNLHYYITKLRIARALELLADSKLKIFEISEMVGYSDEKYFSRLFKKVMQSTPNEYRKRLNT